MADFWGWGAGMVGVAVRCNWRLEKNKLISSHRKNIVQIHVNTHIQVYFRFAW